MRQIKQQFDIALSFAGEDRAYVEKVAAWLLKMGYKVFYDKYETVTLWGKNLYESLIEAYQKKARYTVMFCSKYYAKKIWTNVERQAAQAKAYKSCKDYILPARFDKTEIPGLLPTTTYIELKDYSPKKFALLIKEKVGPVPRKVFFPDELDILYKSLDATTTKKKESIRNIAGNFFKALSLMTSEERNLLKTLVDYTCPAGPPDNVHINLEYFGRLAKLSSDDIISRLARLDCLGVESKVKQEDISDDRICGLGNILTLRYCPLAISCPKNGTFVVIKIFRLLSRHLCPSCRVRALESLDFSFLSSLAGFPEEQKSLKVN